MFTTLVTHTNIGFFEISEMTIPQIEAILARLGKHISLKLGIPQLQPESNPLPEREHTVEDGMRFAALFEGL